MAGISVDCCDGAELQNLRSAPLSNLRFFQLRMHQSLMFRVLQSINFFKFYIHKKAGADSLLAIGFVIFIQSSLAIDVL